jgi:hypothetical protein
MPGNAKTYALIIGCFTYEAHAGRLLDRALTEMYGVGEEEATPPSFFPWVNVVADSGNAIAIWVFHSIGTTCTVNAWLG